MCVIINNVTHIFILKGMFLMSNFVEFKNGYRYIFHKIHKKRKENDKT